MNPNWLLPLLCVEGVELTFSGDVSVIVPGPFCVDAHDVYSSGSSAFDVHSAGAVAFDDYSSGAVASDANC